MPSTPYAWLAPGPTSDTERLVKMPPTLLRRRMSRRMRSTVKLVDAVAASGDSSVWMLRAPTSKAPALPVIRAPPWIGTTTCTLFGSPSNPIRRL
ncbi:MAG: hypothetical protein F4Y57_14290 [Acidobacteria bacterium]|nr:hypothetical protein [Acidobacteriota bacterium]